MTDEIKAKVEGSQKVARKLERFSKKQDGVAEENSANISDSFSDENNTDDEQNNYDTFDHEFGSSESNQSQDYSQASGTDKYSNNLTQTASPNSFPYITVGSDSSNNTSCCCCSCHQYRSFSNGEKSPNSAKTFVDKSVQTLSTGDVIITKVFLPDPIQGDTYLDCDERETT